MAAMSRQLLTITWRLGLARVAWLAWLTWLAGGVGAAQGLSNDPTRPPHAVPGEAPPADAAGEVPQGERQIPRVAMVRLKEGGRSALINERWYYEGERVQGLKLRRVGANSVDFSRNGSVYTVPVVGHGVDMRLRLKESPVGK